MNTIRKTPIKATYFKGDFVLRDAGRNWAHPIDFPTVFTAYGAAIKSGNWQSCTAINTPQYVIDNYFNGRRAPLKKLWPLVFALENITWQDVNNDPSKIEAMIKDANNELNKLPALK